MKKILSLFVATILATTYLLAGTKTIYCKMEQGWWKNDGAAVGCHSWGTGEGTTWPGVRMTPVEGETDLWFIELDTDKVQNVIFTRVNASGAIADWGAKTKDLTIPVDDNDLFTITTSEAVWGDPGCDGEWSKYEAPVVTEPAVTKIEIEGDMSVAGSELTFWVTVAGFSAEPMVTFEVKAGEGEYEQLQRNKFTPTANGDYTIKATAIYRSDEKGIYEEAFKEVDFTIGTPAAGITVNVTVPVGTPACYFYGEMSNNTFVEMDKVDDTHYTTSFPEATTIGWGYLFAWEKDNWNTKNAEGDIKVEPVNGVIDVEVKAWTTNPGTEYKYTTYTEWQVKYGPAWEWINMTKQEDGLFTVEAVWGNTTGINIASGENPIKQDWYPLGDDALTIAEDVVEGDNVVITLTVVDDETVTLNVAKGEAPVVTEPAVTKIEIEGDMSVAGSELTFWVTVAGFSAEPMVTFEVKAGEGEYEQLQRNKFTPTATGNYTVKATAIYRNDEKGINEEAYKEVNFTIGTPAAGITVNVTVPVGTPACYFYGEMSNNKFVEMTKLDETHYTTEFPEATTIGWGYLFAWEKDNWNTKNAEGDIKVEPVNGVIDVEVKAWTTNPAPAEVLPQITEAPKSWAGEYVITAMKDENTAWVWTGIDAGQCRVEASVVDKKLTNDNYVKVVVEALQGGGYSIKVKGGTNDGKYITQGATPAYKNALAFVNQPVRVDIAMNDKGLVDIYQVINEEQTMYLLYNAQAGANNERFRFYKGSNYGQSNYYSLTLFGTPAPQPVGTFDLTIVQDTVWSKDGAKVAAWIWGEELAGQWTSWATNTNDTLTLKVDERADSIILVRNSPEASEPTWDAWNRIDAGEIDDCHLFIITNWNEGVWCERPVVETKYYAKNNWNGAAADDWSWLEMSATDQENIYMLDSVVFGGTGVNINDKADDADALYFAADKIVVLNGLDGFPGPIPPDPRKRDTLIWAPARTSGVLEAPTLLAGDTIKLFFYAADSTLKAFIIGRPEQPQPVGTFDLTIVQDTVWSKDGAKVAAWIWGEELAGQWTSWATNTNDTLTLKVDERADSIILVRNSPEASEPTWDAWNRIDAGEIDDCHLFIITNWNEGVWCEREQPVDVTYYLVGFINGVNVGCDEDYETLPEEYKFVNGSLTTTFTETSYVFVKTGDNNHWYLSENYVAPAAKVTAVLENGKDYGEKVGVNPNVEVTFTLTENADGSVTLSYEETGTPTNIFKVKAAQSQRINILGQPVKETYRGIVIMNGQTYLQ